MVNYVKEQIIIIKKRKDERKIFAFVYSILFKNKLVLLF